MVETAPRLVGDALLNALCDLFYRLKSDGGRVLWQFGYSHPEGLNGDRIAELAAEADVGPILEWDGEGKQLTVFHTTHPQLQPVMLDLDPARMIYRPAPLHAHDILVEYVEAWRDARKADISNSEPKTPERTGNSQPAGRCPRGQAPEWILGYLCKHHAYDGQSIGNWEPATLDQVVRGLGGHPGRTTVSNWFKTHFGGHDLYKAACQREILLPKLQKLRGDFDLLFDPEEILLNRADPRSAAPARD